MIYFDSSALIKLITAEPESKALSEWVRGNSRRSRTTSAVSKVDVMRSFKGRGPAVEDLASIVLSKIDQLPVQQEMLDIASRMRCPVGSVEAIHLATASMMHGALHAFVSYDPVVLEAAREGGLTTVSPGATLA
ncbi:hypothetical protein FHX42_000613 [Saccharopolyspora lacisalsi]|uniref:PIN domain-containing protein n=1 Tax=Halosaccharopolyspora lacisalsi TaxID=1000566 RepID=A0A839DP80_9PSEU|nr:type II toxin-antitoxin system VapC family toxin [Halosaccharopolyspora lacisalsi]MBA8823284.1 hypothetical protein [Halosaccharopolyspora lacisalsi]